MLLRRLVTGQQSCEELARLGGAPLVTTNGGQLADGEGPDDGRNFESLFVNPLSGAPTGAYLGGGLVLAAALAFYWFVVPFSNGTTGLVTLAVPALAFAAGLMRSLTRRRGT